MAWTRKSGRQSSSQQATTRSGCQRVTSRAMVSRKPRTALIGVPSGAVIFSGRAKKDRKYIAAESRSRSGPGWSLMAWILPDPPTGAAASPARVGHERGELLLLALDLLAGRLGGGARLGEGVLLHRGGQSAHLGVHLPARLGPAEVEVDEGVGEQLGDRQARVPLAVSRNGVPGGHVGAGAGEHVGIGLLVVLPSGARVDVGGVELPVLVGAV